MGTEEVVTDPHSPWQNPFAERLIGSIRRECLEHVLGLSEGHLRRILTSRPVELASVGKIVQLPEVGGLHHRYVRRAA